MAGIDLSIFAGLAGAALLAAFIAAVSGTAGGLILLAIMAFVFPRVLLIPLHTLIQWREHGSLALALSDARDAAAIRRRFGDRGGDWRADLHRPAAEHAADGVRCQHPRVGLGLTDRSLRP